MDNLKVVSVAQMAALEQAAEGLGTSSHLLMERAGLAVAAAIRRLLSRQGQGFAGAPILVIAGPGNNGADGLVAARHLRRWGGQVAVYLVNGRPDLPLKPGNKLALQLKAAEPYAVTIFSAADDPGWAILTDQLRRSRLIIDAVLGMGQSRPLTGKIREVMLWVGALAGRGPAAGAEVPIAEVPIEDWPANGRRANGYAAKGRAPSRRPLLVALDLPTGLNADTGGVDPATPAADVTLTLGFPKVGLLAFPGAERVGELETLAIGLPDGLSQETIGLELLTPGWVGSHLPRRPLNAHKGTFGHTLVVAGCRNYVGAACLVAGGAARAGSGLVTLATPASLYPVAAAKLTEVIHWPLPEDDYGRLRPEAADIIRGSLARYTSLAVGSGMGQYADGSVFMERLLLDAPAHPIPTVIDADGLNNLSQLPLWRERISKQAPPLILTPHPGEMATLTGQSVAALQQDRVAAAQRWASYWRAVVALKGAYTAIAGPGVTRLSPFANPGLATGGSGDALTGIIAGLLAQGLPPFTAACCGVYLHGQAAAALTRRHGASGSLASDLIAVLPQAFHSLRSWQAAD